MTTVRAIYENGHLKLLSPLNLEEGVEVEVMIESARDKMRRVLAALVVDESSDIEDLGEMPSIGFYDMYANKGKPLSELILEERDDTP